MFEIKGMTAAKGFTKEQQKYIADTIINRINENKNISAIVEIIKNQHKNDIKESLKEAYKNDILNLYYEGREDEMITIKLPDCNFKLEIINSVCILIDFLTRKMHANVQLKGQKENKIIEIIKKNYNNKIIKLKDGSITDGNILISSDYIGEFTENDDNIINNPNKLTDLLNSNCNTKIKNNDYKKEENIKFKNSSLKNKHCIFYKNKTSKDFIIINQIYFDLIKRIAKNNKIEVDFYIHDKEEKRRTGQIIVKEKETQKIISLIMPIISNDLSMFENLPDIIEESEEQTAENIMPVDNLTEEEEKKINSKFIKAEAEEKEKEKKVFVSVIDKLKSDYIESKEQRNNFDELLKENLTIQNIKKSFEYEKQTEKAHKKYIEKTKTHINYITGHEYSGKNLEILEKFKNENNYKESAWLGSYQAKKINMQLKKNAKPVQISVIIEKEENKTTFKKIENIYNIADFEPIKKIEESEEFKNIVNELKKAV